MGERYVVQDTHTPGERRRPAEEFVVTYVEKWAAEADAADRNRTWRRKQVTEPYLFSGESPVEFLTSLPEPVFRDWLADHDIPPPGPVPPQPVPKDPRPWYQRWFDRPLDPPEPPDEWDYWWKSLKAAGSLTPAQRDQLADVLDKVVRYQVHAVPSDDDEPAGTTVFVVYENDWGAYDRVPWHTDPVKAFRTWEAARDERDRLRETTGRRYAVVETTLDGRR